jgi:hypothetical protein
VRQRLIASPFSHLNCASTGSHSLRHTEVHYRTTPLSTRISHPQMHPP